MIQVERRCEERHAAGGPVRLELLSPPHRIVIGTLLEVSLGGFRTAHSDHDLAPGLKVHFLHSFDAGEAVVVWTRLVEDQVMSGFLILRSTRTRSTGPPA